MQQTTAPKKEQKSTDEIKTYDWFIVRSVSQNKGKGRFPERKTSSSRPQIRLQKVANNGAFTATVGHKINGHFHAIKQVYDKYDLWVYELAHVLTQNKDSHVQGETRKVRLLGS